MTFISDTVIIVGEQEDFTISLDFRLQAKLEDEKKIGDGKWAFYANQESTLIACFFY